MIFSYQGKDLVMSIRECEFHIRLKKSYLNALKYWIVSFTHIFIIFVLLNCIIFNFLILYKRISITSIISQYVILIDNCNNHYDYSSSDKFSSSTSSDSISSTIPYYWRLCAKVSYLSCCYLILAFRSFTLFCSETYSSYFLIIFKLFLLLSILIFFYNFKNSSLFFWGHWFNLFLSFFHYSNFFLLI